MSTFLLLFWTFFKISLFSIGGGYNMIPLMQHEIAANGWLPPGRFMDVLAVSEITPGPMAVNLATFAGYQVAGIPGSVVATVGVCLPGALLLLALGTVAIRLRDRPAFRAAMRGLMPALVGLLAATAIRLWISILPEGRFLPDPATLIIFGAALGLFLWKNLHPALLMLGAAAAGIIFSML
jgi:chromate transporter